MNSHIVVSRKCNNFSFVAEFNENNWQGNFISFSPFQAQDTIKLNSRNIEIRVQFTVSSFPVYSSGLVPYRKSSFYGNTSRILSICWLKKQKQNYTFDQYWEQFIFASRSFQFSDLLMVFLKTKCNVFSICISLTVEKNE